MVKTQSNPERKKVTDKEFYLLFQEIFRSSSDAVIVLDRDQQIILFNRRAKVLFGYKAEEMIGKPLDLLIPKKFRKIHPSHIKKFETEEKSRMMNQGTKLCGLRKNGEEFPLKVSISKLDINKNLYFMGLIKDVSERRSAENALSYAYQSLRESNEKLTQLLEATPVCIYTCKAADNYDLTYIGPSVHKITGYTADDFINRPSFWAEHIHPEDMKRVLANQSQLFETGRHDEQYRFRVADGSYKWLDDFTRLVKKPDGKPDYIIGVWADITEKKQAEEKVYYRDNFDALTGLPNRALLLRHLREAIQSDEQNRPVALLLMDLDRFREINNTLGHHNGDILINEVAIRLQDVLFRRDLVGRMGGDEFAIIAPLAESDHTGILVNKIMKAMALPFLIEEIPIMVEISIGIAFFPDHGQHAGSLMQHAEVAMYSSKQTKKGYVIYDSDQDQHDPRKLALTAELHRAIEQDELALHYQPKIDLKTKQVIGVEALLRWIHPEWGFIPPDQFIGLAERTGLIKPLSEWVFNEAHRQGLAFHQMGIKLNIAINFSARNIQDPQMRAVIEEKIKHSGLSPGTLELEITENVIMDDPEGALEVMHQLRSLGITFTIDDFGTGYSSLIYLKKLPVSSLKIDRSFVMEMMSNKEDAAIVRSTIDLGHSLGLLVIAEGVENKETFEELMALGCDAAQGYYMCRPIPPEALATWLNDPHWD